MATYFTYEVKIGGSNSNSRVSTTIADSSLLVDISLYKLWELISECKVGMIDDEQEVADILGLTIECCDDDADGSISSINTKDKVATLQLCYESYGILIQLLHLEEIPSSLRSLLTDDRNVVFVGVGIRDACAKLERDYGLKCKSIIELAPMASRVCGKSQFFDSNLEELAHEIKGINIEKPTIPSLSLWGAREIRKEQMDYAITKAYASYSIGQQLMRGR